MFRCFFYLNVMEWLSISFFLFDKMFSCIYMLGNQVLQKRRSLALIVSSIRLFGVYVVARLNEIIHAFYLKLLRTTGKMADHYYDWKAITIWFYTDVWAQFKWIVFFSANTITTKRYAECDEPKLLKFIRYISTFIFVCLKKSSWNSTNINITEYVCRVEEWNITTTTKNSLSIINSE